MSILVTRLYQETYFPLLYFCVMSAQTHFIVNGNWYSFYLNVPDIVHTCSSVTWSMKNNVTGHKISIHVMLKIVIH